LEQQLEHERQHDGQHDILRDVQTRKQGDAADYALEDRPRVLRPTDLQTLLHELTAFSEAIGRQFLSKLFKIPARHRLHRGSLSSLI
jgi:hypothetical protein